MVAHPTCKVPQHEQYGLACDEAEALFRRQSGRCNICRKPFRPGRPPNVDHHHATGRVRGLLCATCNRTLGYMHEDIDWLDRALSHLHHGATQVRQELGRNVYTPNSPGDAGLVQEDTP
jgi:hypothetical protein